MTLLQGIDGGDYDYLDLGAELSDVSSATDADVDAMWRRIAFSVSIHNTDDHMRNHGLVRDGNGWRLSPIFDVNPNPDVAEERSTMIAGASARGDEVESLLLVAPDFGINRTRTQKILAAINASTANGREVAACNDIPEAEIRRFEGAFDGLREQFAEASNALK